MEKLELNNYQSYTLNKLFKHDNSFLVWPRQSGKTTILTRYLEEYVKNNYGKDIIFICNNKSSYACQRIKWYISEEYINRDRRDKNVSIDFINDNIVDFFNIEEICRRPDVLHRTSLIMYDDFYNQSFSKIRDLIFRIDNYKIKSIFTTVDIDIECVRHIDFRNNYYFNISSNFINYDEYIEHFAKKSPLYNKPVDYQKFIEKEMPNKPKELLDFNLSYLRKIKLEILNKISNEI